ncbi:MAG: hypothetical protein PHC50_04925 [Candidatus Cloacimonetes bacterium]|nr:hypothetical protein [Candidatus Cloacimonadota bacterium]
MVLAKGGNKHSDHDILDDSERLEYGVDFGIDVVFLKQFMAGLRYDMGLSNIAKDIPKKYEIYNRTLMFNLSYILGSAN